MWMCNPFLALFYAIKSSCVNLGQIIYYIHNNFIGGMDMTYFNQLDPKGVYKVLVQTDVKSRKTNRHKCGNFLFEMTPAEFVHFANTSCKGLSHYGVADVKVILVFDCSALYEVYTNNITVPYIGVRNNSFGKTECYPHYRVNPFYEMP